MQAARHQQALSNGCTFLGACFGAAALTLPFAFATRILPQYQVSEQKSLHQ